MMAETHHGKIHQAVMVALAQAVMNPYGSIDPTLPETNIAMENPPF